MSNDKEPVSKKRKCSYCSQDFEVANKQYLPFCSRRCKEIDLSNWLTESYGLPFEGDSEEEDRLKKEFYIDTDKDS